MFSKLFAKRARGNRVLNFSWSFRRFALNKRRKQSTETRQARHQLHFAQKIIKNHLTVLENELIEVCMLISKSAKTVTRMLDLHVCIYWNFAKAAFEWAIHTWRSVDFSNFSVTNMQTSINSFSKTVKWILMFFGAKWSWGLACLVSVLHLLRLFSAKRRKLQEKFRTLFPLARFAKSLEKH